MARVVMQAVVSVDGYIAYLDDTVGPLFDWYGNGNTTVSARASGWTFPCLAGVRGLRPALLGRHQGDGDRPSPVRHHKRLGRRPGRRRRAGRCRPPAIAAGVARRPPGRTLPHRRVGRGRIALAKKLAGDGLVCVTAGDLGGQAFSAGLVDEIAMDVAPVVLGEGVRFFGSHAGTVLLDDPDQVVQGDRVLHLHYILQR